MAGRRLRQLMHRMLERSFAGIECNRFLHMECLFNFWLLFPHLLQKGCVKCNWTKGRSEGGKLRQLVPSIVMEIQSTRIIYLHFNWFPIADVIKWARNLSAMAFPSVINIWHKSLLKKAFAPPLSVIASNCIGKLGMFIEKALWSIGKMARKI